MDESLLVENSVQQARQLYKDYREKLMSESVFVTLLKNYSSEIERSSRLMVQAGLPDFCGYCATSIPGGGCCGEHIATWYDPHLLLLNMLMGIEIQDKSYYKDSCRFLGRNGCTLKARYHFCVNYLCQRIYEKFDKKAIESLRAQSGKELFACWQLELFLADYFKKNGRD